MTRWCAVCARLLVLIAAMPSAVAATSVRRAAMESGADGFVLTRAIATDLLPAVEAVLAA